MLSHNYKSQVYRALKFDENYRSYKNLITPENVQKYLLDDIPVLSSTSLHGEGSVCCWWFLFFLPYQFLSLLIFTEDCYTNSFFALGPQYFP